MPYTQEELKSLQFYQDLKTEDERDYLAKKELLEFQVNISGSTDGSLVLRNDAGTVMVFENPYTGELYEDDPSSKIIVGLATDNLTNNISIDAIIDREFKEL